MTSTHLSLHYHLVFSTKGRRALIVDSWRERMYGYLGGILRRLGGVAEEIGGTRDHIHILACLKATHRLADVMCEVKSSSSEWIHRVINHRLFSWQDGYGAFTVSEAQIKVVREYVRCQEEHHRKRTYQEEYISLLHENGIDFDERYLW